MIKKEKYDHPEVIHLLKRKKKGLLRLIFSRFGITALLLILQIALIIAVAIYFNEYTALITMFGGAFTVIMVLHLFESDMDATAKLTWLLLMIIFPLPISVMLVLTKHNIGHRMITRKLKQLTEESKGMIQQDESVLREPEIVDSATDDLCHYLNLTGCYPLYRNTQVTYFPLGEQKYEAMLRELKKAKKYIFMEYFIIGEGLMWGSILKILAEKAAEGVDVRVMYDGMCEISALSSSYPERMAKYGIKCKAFSRLLPFVSTHYNYRDHRKILVIDGEVAFNGGVNLADEYINHIERFGHWKDTALMLKGDAVQSFTLMFLQMWNITEKQTDWKPFIRSGESSSHDGLPSDTKSSLAAPAGSVSQNRKECDGFVMPYADSPLDGFKVGENIYMDILNRAKKYVHIMTPYLVLDNELETALKYAAQRGIDVKLILPGIPDKKMAYALAKSYYIYLINAGIKIYEYTPGFVHAKVFVSDDIKGVTGTINLDYRSLYHHFECATYLYNTSCIAEMEDDFQKTLACCREVTPETIKHEKISTKLRGSIMKLIAPMM